MNFLFYKLLYKTHAQGSASASRRRDGFTLVELLVAASILVSALGAPLYLGVKGIILATDAGERITATYLAEEGIELVRNQRDTNILNSETPGQHWDEFGTGPNKCHIHGASNKSCLVGRDLGNFNSPDIYFEYCGSCDNDYLRYRDDIDGALQESRKYGYNDGRISPYKRIITIYQSEPDEISVKSEVKWESRGSIKTITVEDRLFSYGYD